MDRRGTLELVLARLEIEDALVCYCRGDDRHDRDLLNSVFHPGAEIDMGGFWRGQFGDEHWRRILAGPFKIAHHFIGNMFIRVDGDTAVSETYFAAASRFELDGDDYDFQSRGRYLDQWDRRGGPFKIARRVNILDWARTDRVGATVPGGDGPTAHWREGDGVDTSAIYWGTRSADDKSYELLKGAR